MKIIVMMALFTFVSWGATKPGKYIKEVSKIEKPFEMRDPFKPPMIESKKIVKTEKGTYRNGIYTNLPSYKDLNLENIKIVGVVVGAQRRAMAKFKDKSSKSKNTDENIFVLKEGMKIGAEKAELKAILPGGVVFVEKITNVYGQDEYLETVIPISQE